jgi:hypothetical protein
MSGCDMQVRCRRRLLRTLGEVAVIRSRARRRSRLLLLVSASAAAIAVSTFSAPAFAAGSDPTPDPTPTVSDPGTSTPAPTASAPMAPAPQAPVAVPHLAGLVITGQVSNSRTVVLRGTGLGDVSAISISGVEVGAVKHLSATRIAVRIGTAARFAPATSPLVVRRKSTGGNVTSAVRMRYVATTFRARELQWAWAHLTSRSYTWGHSYIYKYDCANFTSHALVAAGMTRSVLDVSSTSLRRALLARGATELADTPRNREQVRVGDVIQFDWNPSRGNPGDRDHTGIVTAVDRAAAGSIVIRYSAHTDGGNNPSVQLVIERTMNRPHHDPHGKVFFLHLPN